jgi:hypothetical protein
MAASRCLSKSIYVPLWGIKYDGYMTPAINGTSGHLPRHAVAAVDDRPPSRRDRDGKAEIGNGDATGAFAMAGTIGTTQRAEIDQMTTMLGG